MILQTIQPLQVWEEIQNNKIAFSRPDYDIWDDMEYSWNFKKSYQWLKEQMFKRNITPQYWENELFWAWAWSGNRGKAQVDLRLKQNKPQEPSVLITFSKPDSEVLLSHYELWHYVLNYWAIISSQDEEEFWDKMNQSDLTNYYKVKPLTDAYLNQKIEDSWQLIFDLKELNGVYSTTMDTAKSNYLELFNQPQITQATFWNIQEKDIIKTQMIHTSGAF